MIDTTLRQALAYARHGWPVFPCLPGQKIPATRHGYRDATTDQQQITGWFGRHPDWNLASATGAPGPDVLDVEEHGDAGNGYAAFRQLTAAGLLSAQAEYQARILPALADQLRAETTGCAHSRTSGPGGAQAGSWQ